VSRHSWRTFSDATTPFSSCSVSPAALQLKNAERENELGVRVGYSAFASNL